MDAGLKLVTGAAGFIGSRLVHTLIANGHRVVAVDAFLSELYPASVKVKRWEELNSPNLIKIEMDLRVDNLKLLDDFEIDSVFNQAALPGFLSDWSSFKNYYDCNLMVVNRLAEYFKGRNIRSFVQASTSSVYGKYAIGSEVQDLNPTSPYGVSKLAAEKMLLAYHEWFDLPVKILRYFSVYGPHQRPDMAYAKIIDALVNDFEFTVFGDGEQKRSNTYVDDIVDATILAEGHAPSRSVLNICGDETVSLNQAISILEMEIGKKLRRVDAPGRTGDQRDTSGINDKAKEVLNWTAQVGIREGLANQVKAFTQKI
jgi:UDP-glucuronate 4-epimerase